MGLGFWLLGALALAAHQRHDDKGKDNGCGYDSPASVVNSATGCGCRQIVDDNGCLCDDDCGCRQIVDGDDCWENTAPCRCREARCSDCGYIDRNGVFEPGTNVYTFNRPRSCRQGSCCCG